MPTSIQEVNAKTASLAERARQVEADSELVLPPSGQHVARLIPQTCDLTKQERRALLEQFQRRVAEKILPGPDAAHSQDFLYDEYGLPI